MYCNSGREIDVCIFTFCLQESNGGQIKLLTKQSIV